MISVGDEVKLGERDGLPVSGVYLGEWEDREWYWSLADGVILWRVPEIRECIAASEGYRILSADYSQIEIKLMAFLSKDPEMLRALNARDANGNLTDIHCYISTMVYGERLNFTYEDMILVVKEKAPGGKKHTRYKEFKRRRTNIKTTTFGVPYGSGAKGVAARCGITEEEAQDVIDEFFKKFPVLKAWLEAQGDMALKYGETETPYCRKRFYARPPQTDENYAAELRQIRRWAGNHPIQAASADMLKDALRRIYSRIRGGVLNGPKLYDARLILVVHDEIVMLCAEKDIPAVSKIMEECMTEAYDAIIGSAIPNTVEVVSEVTWEKI